MNLTNIMNLPYENRNIIFSFIPIEQKIFLNKSNYIQNHKLIHNYINKKYIEEYIRKTIRQDHDFVFKQIFNENLIKWIQIRNYYYRNSVYSNYLMFLNDYCIDNESYKCQKYIMKMMDKLGLRKNQYKKKYIRYIRNKTI
jgi:hypothetical protein